MNYDETKDRMPLPPKGQRPKGATSKKLLIPRERDVRRNRKLGTIGADIDEDILGRQSTGRTPLKDAEKTVILMLRAKGMSHSEIAKAVNVPERKVSAFLQAAAFVAKERLGDYDFKEDLRMRALDATKAGLQSAEELGDHAAMYDPYKRGNLGMGVLKGLGVLAPDGATVVVNNLINAVPPEWNERYVTLEVEHGG